MSPQDGTIQPGRNKAYIVQSELSMLCYWADFINVFPVIIFILFLLWLCLHHVPQLTWFFFIPLSGCFPEVAPTALLCFLSWGHTCSPGRSEASSASAFSWWPSHSSSSYTHTHTQTQNRVSWYIDVLCIQKSKRQTSCVSMDPCMCLWSTDGHMVRLWRAGSAEGKNRPCPQWPLTLSRS